MYQRVLFPEQIRVEHSARGKKAISCCVRQSAGTGLSCIQIRRQFLTVLDQGCNRTAAVH
jgi:hypothetical protein